MSDTTPTPADLARELIRLQDLQGEEASNPAARFDRPIMYEAVNYAAVNARTIAEALLAAEARVAENAALKAELATLRSQLSRIDYTFGEPNEMRCSPYDVDVDGERVVRQVEAMVATVPEPPTEDAGS